MVDDPADYKWSSYHAHALGKTIKLHAPHQEYLRLAMSVTLRQERYRQLFKYHVDKELVVNIRDAVNKGLALGSERFKEEIQALCGRRVVPAKMGRPVVDKSFI